MLLRRILAVLAAPVVYGVICVPTNWLIVRLFPSQFDENWMTTNAVLLVLLVALTGIFAATSGFVGSIIARNNLVSTVVAICAVQLAIGIAVQRQFWHVLPLWYHLTFFVLLLVGIPLGAWLQTFVIGKARA